MTESSLMSASRQAQYEFSARSFFEISELKPQARASLAKRTSLKNEIIFDSHPQNKTGGKRIMTMSDPIADMTYKNP
mgnify:CR=1 FL=1